MRNVLDVLAKPGSTHYKFRSALNSLVNGTFCRMRRTNAENKKYDVYQCHSITAIAAARSNAQIISRECVRACIGSCIR